MLSENQKRQRDALERLKAEFQRLIQEQDLLMKKLGVSEADLKEASAAGLPQNVTAAADEAKVQAEKAGREAAAALEAELKGGDAPAAPRRRRGLAV